MLLQILIASLCIPSLAVRPERGVFVTCFSQAECGFYNKEEAKRFLVDTLLKGEYGNTITVEFVPKTEPVLIIYGPNSTEISRERVDDTMSYKQLDDWVQSKGFTKAALPPIEPGADVVVPVAAQREVQAALAAAAAAAVAAPVPRKARVQPKPRALGPRHAVHKRLRKRAAVAGIVVPVAATVPAAALPAGRTTDTPINTTTPALPARQTADTPTSTTAPGAAVNGISGQGAHSGAGAARHSATSGATGAGLDVAGQQLPVRPIL